MNPFDPNWPLFRSQLNMILPECVLVLGMCLVILVPFLKRKGSGLPTLAAALTLLGALAAVLMTMSPKSEMQTYGGVFNNVLMIDPFSQFFKILLLLFTMLVVLQWMIIGSDDLNPLDVPDFLCLVLGATVGMSMMASANNLLMILIAIETASLPSFALAGFRKATRHGSEGAIKYVLFGAASSAIMIYGMSLIYGTVGSLALADIALAVRHSGVSPLMGLGIGAMIVGIGFKLSAVPMHFWCPDVFQGAPIPITTFLSVASKGAAIVLLLRVMASFNGVLAHVEGLVAGVAILGAITATWGNIMAIQQTHLRRLLAFSSIAHAGYMIMAVALAAATRTGISSAVSSAILFYLIVYMFMNLGAFTVGAMILKHRGSEDIRDFAGMFRTSPLLVILMSIFLLSLFGFPGLGGFVGKVNLMAVMTKLGGAGIALIAVLLLNTLISLYYYMRPIYYMIQAEDSQNRPRVLAGAMGLAVLIVCAAMLLFTGLQPDYTSDKTQDFATLYLSDPARGINQRSEPKPAPAAPEAEPEHQPVTPTPVARALP